MQKLTSHRFAWPAVRTIDTFGRRALLLVTFPNMAWTLLAAAFCFKIPIGSSAHLPVLAVFIYLFSAFYSPGEGPVPFTYSAEAFPLFHRGKEVICPFVCSLLTKNRGRNEFGSCGQSIFRRCVDGGLSPDDSSLGSDWRNWILRVSPQDRTDSKANPLTVDCSGLNVLALIMIFLWVPETKQRTLEELDYICNSSARTNFMMEADESGFSRGPNTSTHAVPGHRSTALGLPPVHPEERRRFTPALQVSKAVM